MRRMTLLVLAVVVMAGPAGAADWYKGVTHMHSLWSDGDTAPELAVAWYKDHGYHFACLTDHNCLPDKERWVSVREEGPLTPAQVEAIRARFGKDAPVLRESDSRTTMRLKTEQEIAQLLNEPGKFLYFIGEEITTPDKGPHMSAWNPGEVIPPAKKVGNTEAMNAYLAAQAVQTATLGRPMMTVFNHPNFSAGITIEEALGVNGLRFFEVYNGHPAVNNWGDEEKGYPTTDRYWDVLLAHRAASAPAAPLCGLATDDAHDFFEFGPKEANPGRGWIMVHADNLEPGALIDAMRRGDFYASTGVLMNAIEVDEKGIRLQIAAEPGVRYTTQFIGTRKDADLSSNPVLDANGQPKPRASRQYGDTIGQVLLETAETEPAYAFQGTEMYVRARIVSDKAKENPFKAGDTEMAWTQPVFTGAAR